ncbi:hypothetical protein AAC03nite_34070 [Alicyclobacillus acidoterrestris]|nr:hypothetical protein AAC03nite_34070 [Alicyclobacillus acidoterrestris]
MGNDQETLDYLLRTYGRDILHFIRFYTKNNHDADVPFSGDRSAEAG